MNRTTRFDDPATPDAAPPDALDRLLQRHLAEGDESADDGFTDRVLAALPAPTAQRPGRWLTPARWALWAASSVAACLAAVLLSATGGRIEGEEGIAALALLALLALWSWPARWLRP